MGVAKARVLVGNDHVTQQGHRGPQAHGIAVNRPNDRLLHLQHVLNQALGAPEGDAPDTFAQPAVHSLDITAGTEGAAGTRQHDGVDSIVVGDLGKEGLQLGVHLLIDGVERFGAIQGYGSHLVGTGNLQGVVAAVIWHKTLLLLACCLWWPVSHTPAPTYTVCRARQAEGWAAGPCSVPVQYRGVPARTQAGKHTEDRSPQ